LAQGGRLDDCRASGRRRAGSGTTPRQPFARRCPRLRRSAVPPQLWKTHAAFTRLYAGQGKADESERAQRAARHVLESVRERLQNPGLRQSLAVLIRQALS
jgi:hypothetical protein